MCSEEAMAQPQSTTHLSQEDIGYLFLLYQSVIRNWVLNVFCGSYWEVALNQEGPLCPFHVRVTSNCPSLVGKATFPES